MVWRYFKLKDQSTWAVPSATFKLEQTTKSGKQVIVQIDCWEDMRMKGSHEHKLNHVSVKLVKIVMRNKQGDCLYKKPIWLISTGKEARKISCQKIWKHYKQRFDIEHFFKFAKSRLLMESFQTPDTPQEENWMTFVMLAAHNIYHARLLAKYQPRPWDKKNKFDEKKLTPFVVQRDMERILSIIGTPAKLPKTRGIPKGRKANISLPKRQDQKVVCKASQQQNVPTFQIKLQFKNKRSILKLKVNSDQQDNCKIYVEKNIITSKIETGLHNMGINTS